MPDVDCLCCLRRYQCLTNVQVIIFYVDCLVRTCSDALPTEIAFRHMVSYDGGDRERAGEYVFVEALNGG